MKKYKYCIVDEENALLKLVNKINYGEFTELYYYGKWTGLILENFKISKKKLKGKKLFFKFNFNSGLNKIKPEEVKPEFTYKTRHFKKLAVIYDWVILKNTKDYEFYSEQGFKIIKEEGDE